MGTYTEQDELEKLKAWWKNYGGALVLGVALGLVLLFGNKYWQQYKDQRREAASNLYIEMLQDARDGRAEAARGFGERLVKDYDDTPYAGMAALMLARMSYEANDAAGARQHLQWAVDHARDPATQHAARLRLGRVLADAGEYDAALALTGAAHQEGFEAEYLELKGDVLALQAKPAAAREAYRAALPQLPADSPYRRTLTMKLDDLGGGG